MPKESSGVRQRSPYNNQHATSYRSGNLAQRIDAIKRVFALVGKKDVCNQATDADS
jgi:hypothetical protein